MSLNSNQTTCPNCGHKFDAGEALQKHLKLELEKQANKLNIENQALIDEFKKKFEKEKQEFEEVEKRKLWAIAQQKADEKTALKLKSLEEDNQAKHALILESQKKELELLKKEQQLKEKQELLLLEMEKEVLKKTALIEETAKKKKDEEFELVKKEYEKKLDDQMNLVKEMQRKAEQGSMQLQGEIQELVLENLLASTFIYDTITEVKKGQRGADAIQTVINEFGQSCGKIIFESKRTQGFSNDWIDKLKDDQRAAGAEIAVLVTQTMPKDFDKFGEKDGVYICGFHEVKSLVYVLRQMLLRTNQLANIQENKTEKMSILYNYLVSSQFKQQLMAIVEGFTSLKEELDKEKRAMQRIWKEREVQIEKVITNTIDMYGSIKGIAGNAIEPIKYLELGGDESLD
jgi:hypothetical protein